MSSNPEGSKASAKARAGNSTSPGFLEKIDRYGYIPQLMYGGDTACKSQFGGFLTFGEGLCYVFLVCFTVYRYFERKSPSTSLNRVFRQDPEGFSVTDSTMPFAFGIQNPSYEHFIDETVYKVEAFYTESIKTVAADGSLQTEYKKTKLNLVPCSQVGLDSKYFNNLELKSMFCLENYVTKKLDLKISGRFESNYFSRIEVSFKRCKGSGCKSNTEIDKLLRDSYFAINYKDRVAELTQFESPVNQFPTSIFTSCSTDYLKYLHMYMADNTIVTDSSLVGYMELDRIRFPSTGTYKTDFSQLVRSGEDYPDVFFNLVVRMDPIENIYNRKYNNVYNYLAEFGGLTQIIMLAVFLATFRYHDVYLNFDLAKKYLEKNKLYHHLLSVHLKKPSLEINNKPKNFMFFQRHQVGLELRSNRKPSGSESTSRAGFQFPLRKNAKDAESLKQSTLHSSDSNRRILLTPARKSIGGYNMDQVVEPSQEHRPTKRVSFSAKANEDWESGLLESSRADHKSNPHKSILRPGSQNVAEDMSTTNRGRELLESRITTGALDPDYIEGSIQKRYLEEYEQYVELATDCKKVSFWDFLVACVFPCGSLKTNLSSVLQKSRYSTNSNFDILKITNAVDEVEKLKNFLFTPAQQLLYNLLPRQLLGSSESTASKFYSSDSDDISGMYDSVREALKSIKSSESHSEWDLKFLRHFDSLISIIDNPAELKGPKAA